MVERAGSSKSRLDFVMHGGQLLKRITRFLDLCDRWGDGLRLLRQSDAGGELVELRFEAWQRLRHLLDVAIDVGELPRRGAWRVQFAEQRRRHTAWRSPAREVHQVVCRPIRARVKAHRLSKLRARLHAGR